jgi:hypothetical protein
VRTDERDRGVGNICDTVVAAEAVNPTGDGSGIHPMQGVVVRIGIADAGQKS